MTVHGAAPPTSLDGPRSQLVVVGGLPGTGKSRLADALGEHLAAPVFAKDHVEASLWRSGVTADRDSWQVAEDLLGTLAGGQLQRAQSAILDTVARRAASRAAWRAIAREHGAAFRLVECVCSDETVHRTRLDGRVRAIPGWYELTWADVEVTRSRWEPWLEQRLIVDAVRSFGENLAATIAYLDGAPPTSRALGAQQESAPSAP